MLSGYPHFIAENIKYIWTIYFKCNEIKSVLY